MTSATEKVFDVVLDGLGTAHRELDKLIVSVSSGVLALSVAFFNQLDKPVSILTLKVAWGSFMLAIVSILASLLIEIHVRNQMLDAFAKKPGIPDPPRVPWLIFFNALGIVGFLVGMLSLTTFLFANTWQIQ